MNDAGNVENKKLETRSTYYGWIASMLIPASWLIGYIIIWQIFNFYGVEEAVPWYPYRLSDFGYPPLFLAIIPGLPFVFPFLERYFAFFRKWSQLKWLCLPLSIPLMSSFAKDLARTSSSSTTLLVGMCLAFMLLSFRLAYRIRKSRILLLLVYLVIFSVISIASWTSSRTAFAVGHYNGKDYAIIANLTDAYLVRCEVVEHENEISLKIWRGDTARIDFYDETYSQIVRLFEYREFDKVIFP